LFEVRWAIEPVQVVSLFQRRAQFGAVPADAGATVNAQLNRVK